MAMPDSSEPGELLAHVEDGAGHVEHASRRQQNQGDQGAVGDHRLEGDHHEPAQGNIEKYPESAADTRKEELPQGPEDRQSPDSRRHAPRPGARKIMRGEGRIGPGDHQKNACVIQATQQRTPPRRGEIIGRRKAKHRQQADRVDANGEDEAEAPLGDGKT